MRIHFEKHLYVLILWQKIQTEKSAWVDSLIIESNSHIWKHAFLSQDQHEIDEEVIDDI